MSAPTVTRICQKCERAYEVAMKRVNRGVGLKYCSVRCSAADKKRRDPVAYFWSNVNKDGPVVRPELGPCWVWTGLTSKGGYGNVGGAIRPFSPRAHRFSWRLAHGDLDPNLMVCHACDNPPCVNPDHLFLGTQKDNMRDCKRKGRGNAGERHGAARLTTDIVLAIRASGEPLTVLAKRYGIHYQHAYRLRRGFAWQHI